MTRHCVILNEVKELLLCPTVAGKTSPPGPFSIEWRGGIFLFSCRFEGL